MAGQSERVRQIIRSRYIDPALKAGATELSIRARDVLRDAEATPDFPRSRTPLVCNVLLSPKTLRGTGLTINRVDGPASKQSRNVVVHYRSATPAGIPAKVEESPADRANRIVEGLRGLLKSELAEYGGADGFVRWIRNDEAPSR